MLKMLECDDPEIDCVNALACSVLRLLVSLAAKFVGNDVTIFEAVRTVLNRWAIEELVPALRARFNLGIDDVRIFEGNS